MKKKWIWHTEPFPCFTKTWRIMRLSVFFLCVMAAQTWALDSYSQVTRLSLNLKDTRVIDVLGEIEEKTEFFFLFNQKLVDVERKVDIEVRQRKIDDILNELFAGTNVNYLVMNRQIVLTTAQPGSEDYRQQTAVQQQGQVTGKVTDRTGSALPGVTVVIKGTTTGTITNSDGNYSISNVSPNATLVFSFVGMRTQEIIVSGKSIVNLSMEEEQFGIGEVVAIGYGTVRKRDLTGAVSQVSSDVIRTQSVTKDAIQILQGKVPGLDITTGNKPGDVSTPIIRGYNSINASNAPLIVLDGAPFGGRLSDINPSEIENIDVLKDASSTAIYGSRGANGVIIITTKRAKDGKRISVAYDGYAGVSKSFKDLNVMSGDKWANYLRAANPGRTDSDLFDQEQLDILQSKNFVDWQKLMFDGTGYETDHNFSLSTDRDGFSNLIILGYNKNQSILKNISYERFSARINGDLNITDKFSLGYSSMLAHSVRDNGASNVFLQGALTPPVGKAYHDDGELRFYPSTYAQSFVQSNPLFEIDDKYLENKSLRDRVFFNLFASWKIIKGLEFKSMLTTDWQFLDGGSYYSSTSNARTLAPNSASYSKITEKSLTFTNFLNYKKEFKEHSFDLTVVNDMQKYAYTQVGLTGQDIAYYGKWYNVAEAPNIFTRSASINEWAIMSFMGRLNYSFKDRYLLTFTGRIDGSSRLAKGHQWDFFPSVAVAWRISSEPFMEAIPSISNLKLRLSWGNTGNTAINPYATQGALGKYVYAFGAAENAAVGYLPTELPNVDLGWEITEEYNIGLDLGLIKNRVSGSVDLYQRNTNDLLMRRSLPISSGYDNTWQNIGSTRNSGIEVALNTVILDVNDWKWDINLSFAHNKNEIVELYNGKIDDPGNKWFIGQPLFVDWLYEFDGVWQIGQEAEAAVYGRKPGDARVQDKNDSKTYDTGDLVIHNKIPKWTGGISSSLKYKNFDFNFYAYTRQDYGSLIGILTFEAGSSRWNALDVDFWTPDNPSNASPRPQGSNAQPLLVQSNYAFRDLSFVRLKNLNLGFTFSKGQLQQIRAEKLRVYVAVDNPFVWTMNKFEGLDPENATNFGDHRPLTTFLLGVNVNF